MGSTSDWEVMSAAADMLDELGIEYEKRVVSAHRTPQLMYDYATTARERGIGVINCSRKKSDRTSFWNRATITGRTRIKRSRQTPPIVILRQCFRKKPILPSCLFGRERIQMPDSQLTAPPPGRSRCPENGIPFVRYDTTCSADYKLMKRKICNPRKKRLYLQGETGNRHSAKSSGDRRNE